MSSPLLPIAPDPSFLSPFFINRHTFLRQYALLTLLLRLPPPISSRLQLPFPTATQFLLFRLNWHDFLTHNANRHLTQRLAFPELLLRIAAGTNDAAENMLWEEWILAAAIPDMGPEKRGGEAQGLVGFEWRDVLQAGAEASQNLIQGGVGAAMLADGDREDLRRTAVCVLHVLAFPTWPLRMPLHGILAAQVCSEMELDVNMAASNGLLALVVSVSVEVASEGQLDAWRGWLEEAVAMLESGTLQDPATDTWGFGLAPQFAEMNLREGETLDEEVGGVEQELYDGMEVDGSVEEDTEMEDVEDHGADKNSTSSSRASSSGADADIEDNDYDCSISDFENLSIESGDFSKRSNNMDMTEFGGFVDVFANQYDSED